MTCQNKSVRCLNCHEYFEELKPNIKEVIITHNFKKDAPDFDTSFITDCKHEYFVRLHKLEVTVEGNHIFRAYQRKMHYVYAIDKKYRLIFLRAFDNFKEYKKFLDDKKKITSMISSS